MELESSLVDLADGQKSIFNGGYKMMDLNQFTQIDRNELSNVKGGNIFSQTRDVIWGVIDGIAGKRHGYKQRHKG